jgi:hypothetical protein
MAQSRVVTPAKFAKIMNIAKRGKEKRPDGMSNSDWFKRNANRRIPKTLKMLKGIARLSNTESFEYTDKQVSKLISALEEHLEYIKDAFANPRKSVKVIEQKFY